MTLVDFFGDFLHSHFIPVIGFVSHVFVLISVSFFLRFSSEKPSLTKVFQTVFLPKTLTRKHANGATRSIVSQRGSRMFAAADSETSTETFSFRELHGCRGDFLFLGKI